MPVFGIYEKETVEPDAAPVVALETHEVSFGSEFLDADTPLANLWELTIGSYFPLTMWRGPAEFGCFRSGALTEPDTYSLNRSKFSWRSAATIVVALPKYLAGIYDITTNPRASQQHQENPAQA